MGKKLKTVQPINRITPNRVGGSKYVFYGYNGVWSFDADVSDVQEYVDTLHQQLSFAEDYMNNIPTKEDLL